MLETLETLYCVSFSPSSMVGSMAGLPKVNSSMAGLGDGVRGETPSRPYASSLSVPGGALVRLLAATALEPANGGGQA